MSNSDTDLVKISYQQWCSKGGVEVVTDLRIGHGLGSRDFVDPAQLFPMMTPY